MDQVTREVQTETITTPEKLSPKGHQKRTAPSLEAQMLTLTFYSLRLKHSSTEDGRNRKKIIISPLWPYVGGGGNIIILFTGYKVKDKKTLEIQLQGDCFLFLFFFFFHPRLSTKEFGNCLASFGLFHY